MTIRSDLELPTPERLREIAELAEFIADEFWQGDRLDPLTIADKKEITYTFNDYGDSYDGLLEHRGGRFHIYANLRRIEARDAPRARFTLGHELGHFFIDDHRQALASGLIPAHRSRCDFESKNPAEREADHFACNLLLPSTRFITAAHKAPRGLTGILGLARRFGSSVTSTAIRYATLSIGPCAVVKWNGAAVTWKWFSGEAREAGFRKSIEEASALAPGSPTHKALAGQKSDTAFFRAGTTAAAWFPWIFENSYKNVLFMEEAIALGRFGVLTFLYPEQRTFDFNNPL